jgi:hypothetical protein
MPSASKTAPPILRRSTFAILSNGAHDAKPKQNDDDAAEAN